MTRKPHICILTSAHPLDDVRVNTKVAASFVDRGFKVSWVGPDVSFFVNGSGRNPEIDYYLTRPTRTRLDRLLSASRISRRVREVVDVDWYYSPDPDAARVSVATAKRSGGRTVFDIHEVYHGAHLDRWLFGFRVKLARELLRRRIATTCRRSDLVIGVNDSVLRPYVSSGHKSLAVRNCAPRWFADRAVVRTDRDSLAPMTFMHGKGLIDNGTPVVLKALSLLPKESAAARVVVFASPDAGTALFMPAIRKGIAELRLGEEVWLHDFVAHEKMPPVLAQCDVGLVAYGRGLGEDSLPNRLFEYMASGLAVLAPTYAVEIKRIVDDERIGLTVDFEDPAAVATAMQWFVDNPDETLAMGTRARSAFLNRHNWDVEFEKLIDAMAGFER